MTDTMDKVAGETSAPVRMEPAPGQSLAAKIATEELAAELVSRAGTELVSLVGPGGLLSGLTKMVLEAALVVRL